MHMGPPNADAAQKNERTPTSSFRVLSRNVATLTFTRRRTWIGMPLDTCRRMAIPSISDLFQADPPSPPDAMSSVRGSRDEAAPPKASTAAGTCPNVVVVTVATFSSLRKIVHVTQSHATTKYCVLELISWVHDHVSLLGNT